MNVVSRMNELIDKLLLASKSYYSGQKEIMSDHEWDTMFDELSKLENESGIVLPNSPTRNVSHEEILGQKEQHEFPALSLPKSKDIDAVIKWADGKDVNLSWKLDGLTLVVTYDNGVLSKVVTRGDGSVGSNITHLAQAIDNIKEEIEYKGHLVIRGECVISYSDFKSYNAKLGNIYDNPRNLAAGSCNPLSTLEQVIDRPLIWIPFTLVHIDDTNNASYALLSHEGRMKYLESLGFMVVESVKLHSDAIASTITKWSDRVSEFNYPVDGLVITYDDTVYASAGTLTGHHSTRGGFAFKWQDEEAETVLTDIEWSNSVNSINPVAIFEPVRLEGTTVKRASLCNISECERLGIGSKGTKLTVIKANKIIPKIVSASAVGIFSVPDKCPVCDSKTIVIKSATGIKTLVCSNDECPAKNISKMTRFVSKHGFNIQGLSERKLIDLLKHNLIKDSFDILTLSDRRDEVINELLDHDGWGEKSIDNLLTEIENSKIVKSENLLYALCIPGCGRDVSKKIANAYSMDNLIGLIGKYNKIAIMDEIGMAKGLSFYNWFSEFDHLADVERLLDQCNVIEPEAVESGVLRGISVVITGSLKLYSSRDDLRKVIEREGGKVIGSVSSKTDYLINNDIESTSAKNKRAKDLGVPIISEEEFVSKFLV